MPAREFFRIDSPLLVLGGLTIFTPLFDGGTTHFPVLIVRLVLLATVTTSLIVSMRSGRVTVQRTSLHLVLALFIGWSVFSVIRSPYMTVSLQWLISILSYAAWLLLVQHLVDSVRHLRRLLVIILGMGLFEAVLGIHQFVWLGQPRATGTFFNPNFFATYEMAVFAVAFGLLCFRQPEAGSRWTRPFLWVTAGTVAIAFVLAQSRGALLSFVGAVTFVGLQRFGKVFGVVLGLVLLVGALVPNPLQQRVTTVGVRDPFAFTRLDIWENSLQRIVDHPSGVGLGLYKYTSFRYRFPIEDSIVRYGKRAESAHNEYLQMAVELGIVGVVLFLIGAALLGRAIRETLNGQLEPWERGLVFGLSGGILGILIHAAVDSVFHEPAVVLLLILFAGIILVLRRLKAAEGSSVWVLPFPYHPARVALVGVCTVLCSLLIVQPAAAWYAFSKGEREVLVGREVQALDWFQRATRIDPGTAAYHGSVAQASVRLYRQTDDQRWLLKAEEEFKIGLELNPLDGRFAHQLGMIYVLLADRAASGGRREALLSQAAAYYEQAIKLDPFSPFNYLELGRIHWVQGRVQEADREFQRALRYEPNFLPARVQLAELALSLGQKDRAAQGFAEILKIKARYQGQSLTALERQYLDVELDPLAKSLASEARS